MSKRIARAAVTALATASLVTVAAPAAHAGTNGQQIVINSYGCWYSRLWGTNQNGSETDTGRFYLPYYGDNYVQGLWWKGTLHVYCYDQNGSYLGLIHVEVPRSQPSNWYRAFVEPNSVENADVATTTDSIGLASDAVNIGGGAVPDVIQANGVPRVIVEG